MYCQQNYFFYPDCERIFPFTHGFASHCGLSLFSIQSVSWAGHETKEIRVSENCDCDSENCEKYKHVHTRKFLSVQKEHSFFSHAVWTNIAAILHVHMERLLPWIHGHSCREAKFLTQITQPLVVSFGTLLEVFRLGDSTLISPLCR